MMALAAGMMCLVTPGVPHGDNIPWPHNTPVMRRLKDLPPPAGFQRVEVLPGTKEAWLRELPLLEGNPPVKLHNGTLRDFQGGHAAVLDLDVGTRDLQQCADAVIRLHAEWMFSTGDAQKACFHYTSGDAVPFARWSKGERPRVAGNRVRWEAGGAAGSGHDVFRAWLDNVYMYAGTLSVAAETKAVPLDQMRGGDVFVMGGSPGHAVTVVDVARDEKGRTVFLVAQSHMPAQQVHVVNHPGSALDPWYAVEEAQPRLELPEWTFEAGSLKRFPPDVCVPRKK
jgi:hypothetical protein